MQCYNIFRNRINGLNYFNEKIIEQFKSLMWLYTCVQIIAVGICNPMLLTTTQRGKIPESPSPIHDGAITLTSKVDKFTMRE